MCLYPPAIVCRKQDCRMEAGLPRKRGAQPSFGVRTLISASSVAFSGGGRGVPKRPQGCLEPALTQIPEVKSPEV